VDGAPTVPSDLTTQPGLAEADLGRPRAAALAGRLGRLFPAAALEPIEAPFAGEAVAALVARAGVVVHASSDVALAFAANDAAASAGRPLVHGGLLHLSAQLLTVVPGRTGCLRCLFEAPPPGGAAPGPEAATLGPLGGLVGALMGQEAVRLLLGQPATYAGRLLTYGARAGQGRLVPVRPREGCPACGASSVAAGTPAPGTPAGATAGSTAKLGAASP
jgi:molybdopterin/thiamine biosynthesis adenylyltransferase